MDTDIPLNKADSLAKVSADKQASLLDVTQRNRSRLQDELSTLQEQPRFTPAEFGLAEENLGEKFLRGAETGVKGTLNLGYGLGAGASAIVESISGSGGLATKMKEKAAKHYMENAAEISKFSRPEDSLVNSWTKAKDGDFGSMVDWASHGTGYVSSQLATMLVGGGLLGQGVKVVGKKAATQVMSGLVKKEATRMATKALGKASTKQIAELAATDAILKGATSSVASRLGNQVGMATMSFGLEGGEILGDLAQQSIDRGTTLTGEEIGKGLSATALAGAIEYVETVIGLKALKGKLGGGAGVESISGLTGKVTRAGMTGGKVAVAEAGQEAAQTATERWGKGQEVLSSEGIKEIIDAAGMGALGGGPASIGGLTTRSTKEKEAVAKARKDRQGIKPQTAPKFKETVDKAAESPEGFKKYADPKSPDHNVTTAINVAMVRTNKEDVSKAEKVKTSNEAIQLFQDMYKERVTTFSELKDMTDEETNSNPEKYAKLEARVQELDTRIKDTTPLVQALAKPTEDTNPEEVLKEFRKVFSKDSGSTAQSVRNVFGSKSSQAFFDPTSEDFVDLNTKLQTDLDKLKPDEVTEVKAAAKLQESTGKVLDRVAKYAGRVSSDILEGSPEGDYKGIPQHLDSIITAVNVGDSTLAKENQSKLTGWAKSRSDRAGIFDGMYQAFRNKQNPSSEFQAGFDAINTERLARKEKPYFVNNKTFGLIQTMQLEATALQDAAALGQSIIDSGIIKPEVTVQEKTTEPTIKESKPIFKVPAGTSSELLTIYRETPKDTKEGKELRRVIKEELQKRKSKPVVPTKVTVKQPTIVKEAVSKQDKSILTGMGFTEASVDNMTSEEAKEYATYADKTIEQLRAEYKTSKQKTIITQVAKALKTKQTTEQASIPTNVILTTSTIDPNTVDKADYYKINPIQVFGTVDTNKPPTLFNQPGSVIDKLKEYQDSKLQGENLIDTKAAMGEVIRFLTSFNKQLDSIFKPKKVYEDGKDFRWKDSLSYFLPDGDAKLPEAVKTAMGLSAFTWLTTQASTFNDDRTLRRILGLRSSVELSNEVSPLRRVGNKAVFLSESIGRDTLKNLQITFDKKAPVTLEEHVITSFGMNILGVLQKMDLVKRHYIRSGTSSTITADRAITGLQGLSNKLSNPKSLIGPIGKKDLLMEGPSTEKGIRADDFYSLLKSELTDNLLDSHRKAKQDINTLLDPKAVEYDVLFTEPKLGKPRQLTKSDETATSRQTKNLENNERTPYKLSQDTYNSLTTFSIETQKKLAGSKIMDGKHVSRADGIEGANLSIDMGFDAIDSWKEQALRQPNGLKSQFFIPAVFQANSRMRQVGTIMPQNNKVHRALYSAVPNNVNIDPSNPVHTDLFIEAIGLAFGFEASKEEVLADVLKKTKDVLATQEIQNAIKVFDKIQGKDTKVSKTDEQAVIQAVKVGGEDLLTFKGLVEYHKFTKAREAGTSFKSDIFLERDGLANGPFMMSIQLRLKAVDKPFLQRMMSTGLAFGTDKLRTSSDHKVSQDPYESIGAALDRNVKEALDSADSLASEKIFAISNLIGGIKNTDEVLTEHSRKFSKNMTVGAVYGAERSSIVRGLISHVIDTVIPDALESIAKEKDVTTLSLMRRRLQDSVVALSDMSDPWIKGTGPLDTELSYQARDNIAKSIDENYGDALYAAMNEVYGDFREASKILNKGIGILSARYNSALKVLVKQVNGLLTKEDITQIKKTLDPLLPRITTPMGGKIVLFDFAGDDVIDSPIDPEEPTYTRTEQTFTHEKGTQRVSTLYGKARALKILKASGVKPIPTVIHMLDSMTANELMGAVDPNKIGILNVHDAGITNIFDAKKMSDIQNKSIMRNMENYHVASEIQKVVEDTLPKLFEQIKEPDLLKELQTALEKEYTSNKYNERKTQTTNYRGQQRIKIEKLGLKDATNFITSEIARIVPITLKHKREVLDKATYMNQYFDPAGGYRTSNPPSKEVAGIPITELVIRVKEKIEVEDTLITETSTKILSSQSSDLSTDPVDYALEDQINQETVIDLYDSIKDSGSKTDNLEQNLKLKNILASIVQDVIQPLDLYSKVDPSKETQGKLDADASRVFISSHSGILSHGINMSTGEVYVHELVHAITHQALSVNQHLRGKVSRLYDVVYKALKQKYSGEEYRVFLDDPLMDISDPANYSEIELAKDRFDYFFRTPDKRGGKTKNPYTGLTYDKAVSNHLDEFLTYSLTNENFSKFLGQVSLGDTGYSKSTWGNIRGKNIQETTLNLFQAILDFFRGRFTTVNKQDAYTEAASLVRKLALIQSKYKTQRFGLIRKFTGVSGKIHDVGNAIVKKAFHKAFPKAASRTAAIKFIMDDPSRVGEFFRVVHDKVVSADQGIIKTTVQEARGITNRLSDYYQLLTKRKRMLDSVKESTSRAFSESALEFFKAPPSQKEKISITKAGLHVDASVLLDAYGSNKLLDIYQKESVRSALIKQILTELTDSSKFPNTAQYVNHYDRAAMALGDFIVHSRFRSGEDSGLNAQLISELSGTKYTQTIALEDSNKVEPLIDQLVSLYAIGSLPTEQLNIFTALLLKDTEGVRKTLELHKTLKREAKTHLFGDHSRLIIKGYTKSVLNSEVDLKYGTLKDETAMTAAGYTRSVRPLPRDIADPFNTQDIYLYTARFGRLNNLASGILSYTRNKAKGTSTSTLAEQTDTLTAAGAKNTKKLLARKQLVRDRMITTKRNPKANFSTNMVAKVNPAGDVIDYRYIMSEATKDAYLDQVNDFDILLGGLASQIVDKRTTPIINEELVTRLKLTYDQEYTNNPAAFVKIGPNAKDPDMVEQYYLIPEKTRKVINKVWGAHKTMYVPKDLMTLAFGYRKYSILDAFAKKPGERAKLERMVVSLANMITKDISGETGRGIKLMNTTEQLAVELTKYAKDNIIVKSLTVTLSNFASNLVYLRMRAVPTVTILKYGWEAIRYSTRYQVDTLKADKIKIELSRLRRENTKIAKQKVRTLEKDLMQVKDSLNRNPVAESIDSGLMPSLVDDVDTQGQKNLFPGRIEKFVSSKTKKLPKPLISTGKVLFLSKDTEAYKVLNNGVKLTDFIGRHILYKHYTEADGMTKDKAVELAIQEFINFDIPSHRITEYLNEIGLLWFTKYATRIPMVAIKAIKDKPFSTLLAYLISSHMNSDNIIDSAVPNLGYKVDNPLTATASSMDEIITMQLIGTILP